MKTNAFKAIRSTRNRCGTLTAEVGDQTCNSFLGLGTIRSTARLPLLFLALGLWQYETFGQVTFETLASFGSPALSGWGPTAGLSKGDGAWYGTTEGGGDYGRGTVFKINEGGSGSVVLHSFSSGDGWSPSAALTKGNDGAWYGTALGDGIGYGTVFRINENGSGFTVLHRFTYSGGSMPIGSLSKGSDGAWYGTTRDGGAYNGGTVFRINEDSADFSVLHNFAWTDGAGASPYAGLSKGSDGAWYGTTDQGGSSGRGTAFRINEDGSGFAVLHSFSGDDGANPRANLRKGADGAWYGTTLGGGSAPYGTVYRINEDGGGFAVLHRFTGYDGSSPYGGLSLGSDGMWYGTTYGGYDSANGGTVFGMNSDGSGFVVLHSFIWSSSGADGYHSFASLSQGSDGAWYGTTQQGGVANAGTVFRLAIRANTPPVANAGPDQCVSASANCQALVTLDGTGSRDSDGDSLTYTWHEGTTVLGSGPTPTVQLGLGTHQVMLTVDDNKGGTASDMMTIAVVDTTPPTVVCPPDIALPCSVDLLVPANFSATVADNCDAAPRVTYSQPPGSGFPVGTTTVTCTATDASGNASACSFHVTRTPLGFDGFLAPIGGADAGGGSFLAPKRTFKMNSTIPVKFTASCGGSSVLSGVHRLQVVKYTDATTSDPAIDATPQGGATTGNQFVLTDGEWHFNFDTKATGMGTGIWLLTATLSDGSQHSAWIQLK